MTNLESLAADSRKQTHFPKTAVVCASAVLFCLSSLYMAKGFYHMTCDPCPKVPCDMLQRWHEQQYVLRGQNFYDVRFRWDAEQASLPIPPTAQNAVLDPELGLPVAGYAPWSYGTGAALFWPSNWTLARYYYAAINAVSLLIIGWWAYRLGAPYGKAMGWFFSAASLGMGSISYTLGNGQFGIFVLACLALSQWFDEHDCEILSGMLLGMSFIKPTMTLPFLLCFLVKRRWWAIAAAGAYTALASCLTWWFTGTDPLTMLGQMHKASLEWYTFADSQDLFTLITLFDVNRAIAMKIVAAIVLGLAAGILFFWRRAPMLPLFAVAAVAGRLWTYHRNYDNTMLAILLLALAIIVLRTGNRYALAWFFALGLTLWLPPRIADIHSLVIVLPTLIIFIGALAVMLRYWPRIDDTSSQSLVYGGTTV